MAELEHIFGEVAQQDCIITPTDNPNEWEFRTSNVRATFHEPRRTEEGFELRRHTDSGTATVQLVGSNLPWRVETWLEALAYEVSP